MLWKLATPFEPLGFLAVLTLLILAGYLYLCICITGLRRCGGRWSISKGSQFVFLLWCGGFILLLAWLNDYWQAQAALVHSQADLVQKTADYQTVWAISLSAFLVLATPPAIFIMKLLYDRFGPVWRQVLPFFITSIIFGIITIYFQNFRAINRNTVGSIS